MRRNLYSHCLRTFSYPELLLVTALPQHHIARGLCTSLQGSLARGPISRTVCGWYLALSSLCAISSTKSSVLCAIQKSIHCLSLFSKNGSISTFIFSTWSWAPDVVVDHKRSRSSQEELGKYTVIVTSHLPHISCM